MENSKATIFKKMAGVMSELQRIPKNGFNRDQNYNFATAEDVKDAVRKAFASQNLALLIELPAYEAIEITSRSGTVGTKLRGTIEYTIACGDTGETITRKMPAESHDYQDKAFSKLYTIGLKYFLIDTFMISTGDEEDPDRTAPEPVKSQQRQSPPPKTQNSNGKKEPRLTPAQEKVWTAVSAATDYYKNYWHMENAVGKIDFSDPANWDQMVADALDHAREKQADPAEPN